MYFGGKLEADFSREMFEDEFETLERFDFEAIFLSEGRLGEFFLKDWAIFAKVSLG